MKKIDRESNTQGDGNPDCPKCHGRGHQTLDTPSLVGAPRVALCQCVQKRERIRNVEKIWPGLTRFSKIETSPLRELTNSNVLITAKEHVFFAHLKHVALREDSKWFCRLESDQELARAWLANVEIEGGTILDADVASATTLRYVVLDDLAKPPELLIVKLGVKAAANKRMPEVLMEVLQMRAHLNKPTWLFDQPSHRFSSGHLCYSTQTKSYIEQWIHVQLEATTEEKPVSTFSMDSPDLHDPSVTNYS